MKDQVGRAFRRTPSNENNDKNVNGVPLIVTYNPTLNNFYLVIRRNLDYMLTDG